MRARVRVRVMVRRSVMVRVEGFAGLIGMNTQSGLVLRLDMYVNARARVRVGKE